MKNLINKIIVPQYSLEAYKKYFEICDKIIQLGIFVIVLIQLVASFIDFNNGSFIVACIYTFLLVVSIFCNTVFIRECRCQLQNDISDPNFKEENNQYIFEVLKKVSENTRNIYIFFIIAMYSEKTVAINIWIAFIAFAFASIPTVISIKSKFIASIITLLIILINSYSLCAFIEYNEIVLSIVLITIVVLLIIQKNVYKNNS